MFDDEPDDDQLGSPPPPDDRLWRHPSELGGGTILTVPRSPVEPRSTLRHTLAVVAVSAIGGGLAVAGLFLALSPTAPIDTSSGVERIALEPLDSPGPLSDTSWTAQVTSDVRPALVRLDISRLKLVDTRTGVVTRSDGYIVTSAAALADAEAVEAVLADGSRYPAVVVGTDPATDVAVLSIAADDLDSAGIGLGRRVEIGQQVAVAGANFDGEMAISGVVVNKGGRIIDDGATKLNGLLVIDRPSSPASAGGVVVDESGAVVGITSSLGNNANGGDSSTFAIPVAVAHRVADDLITLGEATHPWAALEGVDLDDDDADVLGRSAALVTFVYEDGPAFAAGLEPGDIITRVGQTDIFSMSEFVAEIRAREPSDRVTLTYVRDGKRQFCRLILGST